MWIATEGAAEPNVDPVGASASRSWPASPSCTSPRPPASSTSATGRAVSVQPVGRGQWALATLDAYRPLLERLGHGPQRGHADAPDAAGPAADDPTMALLGNLGQLMGPVMLGMQSGFTVGHLARGAFGQYDLPDPPPAVGRAAGRARHHRRLRRRLEPARRRRRPVGGAERDRPPRRARPAPRAERVSTSSSAPTWAGSGPTRARSRASSTQIDLGQPGRAAGRARRPRGAARRHADARAAGDAGPARGARRRHRGLRRPRGGHRRPPPHRRRTARSPRRCAAGGSSGATATGSSSASSASSWVRPSSTAAQAFVSGVLERAGEEGLARLWHSERELPTPRRGRRPRPLAGPHRPRLTRVPRLSDTHPRYRG